MMAEDSHSPQMGAVPGNEESGGRSGTNLLEPDARYPPPADSAADLLATGDCALREACRGAPLCFWNEWQSWRKVTRGPGVYARGLESRLHQHVMALFFGSPGAFLKTTWRLGSRRNSGKNRGRLRPRCLHNKLLPARPARRDLGPDIARAIAPAASLGTHSGAFALRDLPSPAAKLRTIVLAWVQSPRGTRISK